MIPIGMYGKEKTCWILSAKRRSDNEVLTDLVISKYPRENPDKQKALQDLWGQGIDVIYTRSSTFDMKIMWDYRLTSIDENNPITLKVGQDAVLILTSQLEDLRKETRLTYSIIPADGIFKLSNDGKYLYLSGNPESPTTTPVEYTVTAKYEFQDNEDGT